MNLVHDKTSVIREFKWFESILKLPVWKATSSMESIALWGAGGGNPNYSLVENSLH